MTDTYTFAASKFQAWWPSSPRRQLRCDDRAPLADCSETVDFYNCSSYSFLVIRRDNTRFIVPARHRLMDDPDYPDGYIAAYRVQTYRDAVKLYGRGVSNADTSFNDPNIIGHNDGLAVNVRKQAVTAGGRATYTRQGLRELRRHNEDDFEYHLNEMFKTDVALLELNVATYLHVADLIVVKLQGEDCPNHHEYNHPLASSKVRSNRNKLSITNPITGLQFVWVPNPSTAHGRYSLWTRIGNMVVEIPPTAGEVGTPGLTIKTFDGKTATFISTAQIEESQGELGIFMSHDAAQNWQSPTARESIKHRSEREKYDRQEQADVMKLLQSQLDTQREELKRNNEQHAAEMKQRHEAYLADLKMRDEEIKREREAEQARRQRTVDIWKAASAIAAGIIGIGLAIVKLLEKLVGK